MMFDEGLNLTDIRHGTPEWRARRRRAISGTDVPAILGNSKWKTPLSVWSRIVMDQGGDSESSAFMRWGNLMEGSAAAEYEQQTGIAIQRLDRLAQHPTLPFLVSSPDGFVEDPFREGRGVAEIKCPSFYTRDEWGDGLAPEHYVNQVEANLCTMGLRWGVLIALLPPMSPDDSLIVTKVIELSNERRDEIESTIAAWWERHVVREEQPDAIFRDEEYLRNLHPNDEPRTVLLDGPLLDAAREREALIADIKAKEEEANNIKARLIQGMGSAAWATTPDRDLTYSFRTAKNGVRPLKSIKKLPKAAPAPQAS